MTYPVFGQVLGSFRPPKAQNCFQLFDELQYIPKHNLHVKFHDCICSLRVVFTVKNAQNWHFWPFFFGVLRLWDNHSWIPRSLAHILNRQQAIFWLSTASGASAGIFFFFLCSRDSSTLLLLVCNLLWL